MLDEYQKRAVEHMDGPCLVIAGPGSGKTKCIVERVFNLIRNGVPGKNILVITFTREAAGEMEMRYLKDNGRAGVNFCTFHSLYYHILKDRYGADAIIPKEDKEKASFYDSLERRVMELFEKEPAALKKWQDSFLYVLVDEYQDINEGQFRFLLAITGDKKNLYAVGDDDQSIYSFRGSDPKLMLDFKSYFPDSETITLKNNYRSCRRIVEASGHLILHNEIRYKKDVKAYKDSYGRLSCIRLPDDMTECEYIVSEIKSILGSHSDMTIGVLFRNRFQGALIKEMLIMEQIPFYTKEKLPSIRNGFVFLDLCAMLRIAYEKGTDDDMIRTEKIFGKERARHTDIAARLSPYAAVNYLIVGAGYKKYLHRVSGGNALYEQELKRNLDSIKQIFSGIRTREAFFEMDMDEEDEKSCPDSRVGLYSFHGSKGLEFDHVFIPDVNEGVMPSAKAGEEGIEEERRMFYVAMTRAKKSLTLITVDHRNGKKMYPSRFIAETKKI